MRTGTYRRLFSGVYLVAYAMPPGALEMAATLSCGDGALVSHASAAALGCLGAWRQLLDEPLAVLVVIASALFAGLSANRNAH